MNSKRLLFLLSAFIILHIVIVLVLPPPTRASDLTTQNILAAINSERVARNLWPLNENNLLDEAAQYKTDDMQTRHYFAHVDPDGHYIWDKIVALGYTPYEQLGENLAINFYDTQSLDDAWMQSPEHRANILNAGFKDGGMGLTMGDVSQGQYYSAIANTFGTLVSEQNTKTTAPPTQTPATPTAPKTTSPAPAKIPAPSPAPAKPTATSTPQTPTPVISIRGTATTTEASSSPVTATTSTTSVANMQNIPPANSPTEIVNTPSPLTSAEANRYLTLAFGLILLIFLGHDGWTYIKEKGLHLDKKINNIALLILAIVVVGLMYWL